MTTQTPVSKFAQPWASSAGLGLRLRGSQPIPGSRPARLQTRRSRRSSRRSSFHGRPGRPAAASVRPIEVRCSATCTALRRIDFPLRRHISSRLQSSHPPASQHHATKHPAALRSPMCEGVQDAFLSPHHHTTRRAGVSETAIVTHANTCTCSNTTVSVYRATSRSFVKQPSILLPLGGLGVSPSRAAGD